MKHWGWIFVCMLLVLSFALSGCQTTVDTSETPSDSASEASNSGTTSGTSDEKEGDTPASWSKFDQDTSWAGSDTFLRCSGGTVDMEGGGATFASGKLSIKEAGTYILSGNLDGQIYIEVDEAEKVHLVFNGFSLSCADYSPLYCEEADKVSITLVEGTKNSVTDNGSGYVQGMNSGNGRYAGAIHVKSSLTINGTGSLAVTTTYRHGIVSNKNLRIVSGDVTVNAVEDGVKGKNSLSMRDGTLRVTAGGDGLKVSEEKKEDRGYLTVEGGDITVEAGGDGFDTTRLLQITGGTVRVTSIDHALRCKDAVKIGGDATLELSADSGKKDSDAKGIKADGNVEISGGTLRVIRSFEGIESKNGSVRITGGHIELDATDDGINAETLIEVSGGYLFIRASGDGLDSNDDIVFSGGITVVQGPTNNGNGPLDCGDHEDSVIRTTGGVLIAYGSAGEAKYPDNAESTQYAMGYTVTLRQGTVYSLRDANGNAVCTFTAMQDAQSLCISTPDMKNGATYTLYEGAQPSGTATNGYYADPSSTGGSEVLTFTVSSMLSTNQ